jgi:pimeloyl-ACP methyl ester carboxylesterase
VALACAAAAALTFAPSAIAGITKPGTMVSRPVHSLAPDANAIKEDFVRVYYPLPKADGPHPKRCDWISYLRWRSADGPSDASKADAVLVLIPGFLGGAGSFDETARNAVHDAAAGGKHIEVWVIDRRSNCLENNQGVAAAAKAHNPELAYHYYWGNKKVHGHRFGGWVSHQDAAWLNNVGLKQTMDDWYEVLKTGIPSQRVRKQKVFCGGHSMGGPLTASFADWDFDGNPKTRDDAGYNQCAGFIGLDTQLKVGLPVTATASPSGALLALVIASGSPYVDVPPITPETIQLPPIFGVGSYFDPNGTDLLKNLPHSTNIDLAQRFLFSRDAENFATGTPSIRDFTTTNQLTLGGVFDDNSAPLIFLRSSVGFPTGGPFVDKNFPSPDPAHSLALPSDSSKKYSWINYDKVRKGNVGRNEEGRPYTDREGEVSDIQQLARTMFEAPANFIEQYFPVKLLIDLQNSGNGDRTGDLSHIMYDGIAKRPAYIVRAGDSMNNTPPDSGPPIKGGKPSPQPHSGSITIPGYNHLDVITAARKQNDGRPEATSQALSRFALRVAGG